MDPILPISRLTILIAAKGSRESLSSSSITHCDRLSIACARPVHWRVALYPPIEIHQRQNRWH
jgi:hypothetical protein